MPSVRQQVAEVPAELFKEGGETALDRMHRICVAIWETGVSRAKEVPSSDHTGKDPSEHRNGNCRRDSDNERGQEIKLRISEYWCTKHANTNNRFIGALWTSRRRSTLSPMISSG